MLVLREKERRMIANAEWEKGANEEQLEVIRHVEGPARVLSCAGSGKTFSVVRRVAALISVGVDPDRILCVTFSQKGAQEMDERLRRLGIDGVTVKTWHAFCLKVIKEEGLLEARWDIDDKDREKVVMKQVLGWDPSTRRVYWPGADLTKVRRFIGVCKANLADAESPEAAAMAREKFGREASLALGAYRMRERRMADQGLLAFDDFLVVVARLFEADEDARARWASKFDHVITDEAQDNNRAQVELARHLARDHRNITVVGDLFQAIYGFRGSKPDYLAEFLGEWGARDISMVRNYRSGSKIIGLANAVVAPATVGEDRAREMVAAREGVGEGRVRLVQADNFDDEAEEVAHWVRDSVAGGGSYGDHCVLFRLNAQSRALEDALLREKIPYLIVGGVNFWQRKEVKDLLAYLRVAAGRDEEGDGVRRCINAPFRFLGAAFVGRLMDAREEEPELTWTQLVNHVAEKSGIQQRQRDSAVEWSRMMSDVGGMISSEGTEWTPTKILTHIVDHTKYVSWLEKEEGEESIESSHAANVREMVRVAGSFETVAEFLDYVDQNVRETAKAKRVRGDRVLLMSVHRSKGLEWSKVWVVGCNEKILPHAKGDIEEERRLMYVAITRARDELTCSYVDAFSTKAGVQEGRLSSFLSPEPVRNLFGDKVLAESIRANSSSRNDADAYYDEQEELLSDDKCKVVFLDSYRRSAEVSQ